MKILLTGGRGFIGSHMLELLCSQYSPAQIICLDSGSYAARPPLYLHRPPNLIEVEADIRDRMALQRIMQKHKPKYLVHMAAESHVCRSIAGPEDFMTTNIMGTFNLLEAFKEAGGTRMVHVSTDEVFGQIATGVFSEDSPMSPRNPYAASKASSDLLVQAYHQTYGMDLVTVNMANNFGPNQHREKLIPRTISRILARKPVVVHGDGKNLREWLFVKDACKGVQAALLFGKKGERYCLAGAREERNIDMIHIVHNFVNELLPASKYPIRLEYRNDRPTDDQRYAMSGIKAQEQLDWTPDGSAFDAQMRATVEWYIHAMMHTGRRVPADRGL